MRDVALEAPIEEPAAIRAPVVWTGIALVWVVLFAAISVVNGPDGAWDLRNYHIYNPFAALNGRLHKDLVPAQLQTFLAPTMDIPILWLRTVLNRTPDLLSAVMALPQAAGAMLTCLIAARYVPAGWRLRPLVAVAIAAVGAAGTASFSTLGSVQSEMIPGCFVLAGFLLVLHAIESGAGWRSWVLAGAAFGVAAGLKLTSSPFCIAGAATVLLASGGSAMARIARTVLFCAAMGLVILLLAGWWWAHLYADYGNPLFPYYNNLFRSPYIPAIPFSDERFKPTSVLQTIFYPFYWGFTWEHPTSEGTLRDPRIAFALVGCIAIAASFLRQDRAGSDRPALALLVFFFVSYVMWERQFSIYRYIAPIEMLSGLVVFVALRRFLSGGRGPAIAAGLAAILVIVTLKLTYYPQWGHAPRGDVALQVDFPAVEEGGLVVLLDNFGMSYLIPYAPQSLRFVGVDNNIVYPGQTGRLQEEVERLVRSWPGPLYGLEPPGAKTQRVLDYYGLAKGRDCLPVRSTLERFAFDLCPLQRKG